MTLVQLATLELEVDYDLGLGAAWVRGALRFCTFPSAHTIRWVPR